jgi:hypothetical protein
MSIGTKNTQIRQRGGTVTERCAVPDPVMGGTMGARLANATAIHLPSRRAWARGHSGTCSPAELTFMFVCAGFIVPAGSKANR